MSSSLSLSLSSLMMSKSHPQSQSLAYFLEEERQAELRCKLDKEVMMMMGGGNDIIEDFINGATKVYVNMMFEGEETNNKIVTITPQKDILNETKLYRNASKLYSLHCYQRLSYVPYMISRSFRGKPKKRNPHHSHTHRSRYFHVLYTNFSFDQDPLHYTLKENL